MTSIDKKNALRITLQSPEKPIDYDWRSRNYKNLIFIFDHNNDGELDVNEIKDIRTELLKAIGNGKALSIEALERLVVRFKERATDLLNTMKRHGATSYDFDNAFRKDKSIERQEKAKGEKGDDIRKYIETIDAKTVHQFLYDIDGNIIGTNLKETLKNKLFQKIDINKVQKLANKVNVKNIGFVNYTYSKAFEDKTLVEDILDKLDFSTAETKNILNKVMQVTIQACKKHNVNIKNTLDKYNIAISNNDVKSIKQYAAQITKMLDRKLITESLIDNHNADNKRSKLGNLNKKKADELAVKNGVNNGDIVGDGILGNHKSIPATAEAKNVLKVLNELMQDKVFKEKISACVTKKNNCLCVNIPKTKASYTRDENDMVYKKILEEYSIGDGDMSLLIRAIIGEIELLKQNNKHSDLNYTIYNKSDVLKKYIIDLFE